LKAMKYGTVGPIIAETTAYVVDGSASTARATRP
jgi:hypothetical protein